MKRQQRHQQGRRSITLGAGIMVFAVLASALAGCKSGLTENPSAPLEQNSQTEAILEESLESSQIPLEDMTVLLEPEDEYTIWDEKSSVMINLDDSKITIDGQGATANGSTVTIEKSGTYVLKGALSDGTILVDAEKNDTVRLVFNGVDIHSELSAPVDIKKAGKTIISLEEGSVNSLSDSSGLIYRDEEKEEPNGALFSKGDLTINGSGTLKVDGTFNNGICSKDVLKIVGGTFLVTAANHGVKGNDALVIYDGQMTISAAGDGIKSDTLAAILGGEILVSECEEGIEAETVVIRGGTIVLTASDDGINASTDGTNAPQIYFMGGTVTVRAEGDGIDSNGSIEMSGGQITVYGPSERDNGAIDYDREFNLTGGTIMAFGPGGMEQNVSSSESQVSVLADFGETLAAGTAVTLRDSDGNELCAGTGERDFKTVVITVPEMTAGSQYEIQAGEHVITFVPEQTIVYVNKDGAQEAAAMGPGRGGPGGREGGTNGGREGLPSERPESPQGRMSGGREGQPPERPELSESRMNGGRVGLPSERPEPPQDGEGGKMPEGMEDSQIEKDGQQ